MSMADLFSQFKDNFTSAWPMLVGMWWVFTCTFIVFPGAFFRSKFNFMSGMKDEFAWYITIVILIFNIFDTIGRNLGGKVNLSNAAIPLLSASRIVFLPTTLAIAIYNDTPDQGLALL